MTAIGRHFNGLLPAETERLAFLIEELAEAQQAACKILRHGYASVNPNDSAGPNNRVNLTIELGHVQAAITLLEHGEDISFSMMADSEEEKLKAVEQWMHHQ